MVYAVGTPLSFSILSDLSLCLLFFPVPLHSSPLHFPYWASVARVWRYKNVIITIIIIITRYDRRTDRSVRLVWPTSRSDDRTV